VIYVLLMFTLLCCRRLASSLATPCAPRRRRPIRPASERGRFSNRIGEEMLVCAAKRQACALSRDYATTRGSRRGYGDSMGGLCRTA
jgi:hypothetical protein